jgi:hypothetical protein
LPDSVASTVIDVQDSPPEAGGKANNTDTGGEEIAGQQAVTQQASEEAKASEEEASEEAKASEEVASEVQQGESKSDAKEEAGDAMQEPDTIDKKTQEVGTGPTGSGPSEGEQEQPVAETGATAENAEGVEELTKDEVREGTDTGGGAGVPTESGGGSEAKEGEKEEGPADAGRNNEEKKEGDKEEGPADAGGDNDEKMQDDKVAPPL